MSQPKKCLRCGTHWNGWKYFATTDGLYMCVDCEFERLRRLQEQPNEKRAEVFVQWNKLQTDKVSEATLDLAWQLEVWWPHPEEVRNIAKLDMNGNSLTMTCPVDDRELMGQMIADVSAYLGEEVEGYPPAPYNSPCGRNPSY